MDQVFGRLRGGARRAGAAQRLRQAGALGFLFFLAKGTAWIAAALWLAR